MRKDTECTERQDKPRRVNNVPRTGQSPGSSPGSKTSTVTFAENCSMLEILLGEERLSQTRTYEGENIMQCSGTILLRNVYDLSVMFIFASVFIAEPKYVKRDRSWRLHRYDEEYNLLRNMNEPHEIMCWLPRGLSVVGDVHQHDATGSPRKHACYCSPINQSPPSTPKVVE